MAYLGQPPFQEFTSVPTKDSFTGDGSTTTFDLANDVVRGAENALEVFVNNVRQEPVSGKAFTLGVDGSNNYRRITFTAAPVNQAQILIHGTSPVGTTVTPGDGTVTADKLAASARSVSGFDVYNALESCSEHIEQFGGHKYAAGLTLKEENYEAFKQAFEDEVSKTIDKSLLTPEIKVDLNIDLHHVNDKLWRIIRQFAPFGPGNMTPIFMTENLKDTGYGKCVGEDQTHLRLTLTQNRSAKIAAIGFGLAARFSIIESKLPFRVVYSVDENEWNGRVSLQLKLKDLKL